MTTTPTTTTTTTTDTSRPTTRKPTAAEISLAVDAREFGRHLKQGGWRMGLLVARNVVKAPGRVALATLAPKTNATTFARKAGTSTDRVLRYLDAWNTAAEAGFVPTADMLIPGDETLTHNGAPFHLDVDEMPSWSRFYKVVVPRPRQTTPAAGPVTTTTVQEREAAAAEQAADVARREAAARNRDAANNADNSAERAVETAGANYQAQRALPDATALPGAALRISTDHAAEVRHNIAAIRSYTRRLVDLARDPEWTVDRAKAADDMRNLATQLALVADLAADPATGIVTDEALTDLLNNRG